MIELSPAEEERAWRLHRENPIVICHDHDIFLEVTESVPLTHFDRCMAVARELRARRGIYLVVDDLGAGHSNLKTISDLEPRMVKLDRGLIAGLDRNPRQRLVVASVVKLCEKLQATVVAEGVETVAEYEAAVDAGVKIVILPAENEQDVRHLPDYMQDRVEIHYVSSIEEVLKLALVTDW